MRGSLATVVFVALLPTLAWGTPAGGFDSSDRCGECHRDIYRMWKASAHARALEDPVFQDALRETEKREGTEVRRICLKCHAPLADLTRDTELMRHATWEGVSCDACHTLAKVDLSGLGPRQIWEPGQVKRGPIRDAASDGHEVAFSELHSTSLVCAGCHEYVNAEGTSIMGTFSEWRASSAADEGRTCQTCHMGEAEADVVDPKIRRLPDVEVNLHEVPGGHSLDQLHKALAVQIRPERSEQGLDVEVQLFNRGAGHAVPTGMPGRRVLLEVLVDASDGERFEDRRTYGRLFHDAAGEEIRRDSGYFAKGVRLVSDTRLKADERRTEKFRFPVAADATAYLTVKLHYEHAPTQAAEERTFLTFLSEKRTLRP